MSTELEKAFHERFVARVATRLPRHRVKTRPEPDTDAVWFDLGITAGASGTVSVESIARFPEVIDAAAYRAVAAVERDALVAFAPMIADRERELQRRAEAAEHSAATAHDVLGRIVTAYAFAADNPKAFGTAVERILFESRTR